MSDIRAQLKRLAKEVKKIKETQEDLENTPDVILDNRERIEDLESDAQTSFEVDDAYFWVMTRAHLDGLFDRPPDQSEEEFRSEMTHRLEEMQMEYFVCQSLAYFLKNL